MTTPHPAMTAHSTETETDAAFVERMHDAYGPNAGQHIISIARRATESTDGWLPIESAPKDTDVLLARQTSDGRWVMELIWTGRSNRHSSGYSDAWVHTHWRPLPPPPGAVPNTPVITDPVVTDEMVERGARAIALAEGQDPDDIDRAKICGPNNEPRPLWEFYAEQALAAIEAALGAKR